RARRDQHAAADVAAVAVVRTYEEHAEQLSLRAGGGLERHGVEAGHGHQGALERLAQGESTLRQRRRHQRMQLREAREPSQLLVPGGVVLHGARAERIEGGRGAIVPLRQPHEVTQDLELTHLGEAREGVVATEGGRQVAVVVSRYLPAGTARGPALEDERLVEQHPTLPPRAWPVCRLRGPPRGDRPARDDASRSRTPGVCPRAPDTTDREDTPRPRRPAAPARRSAP